jgi:hypothetical protein
MISWEEIEDIELALHTSIIVYVQIVRKMIIEQK